MNKDQIIQMAAKAGAEAALEAWDKKWKEEKREQHNKRLWNTRMLLRHFSSLKEYCNNAVYNSETAQAARDCGSAIDILESLGTCSKDTYIDSIKSSVVRTQMIMAHVELMLELYQAYCNNSKRPEDARRYRVLQAAYLAPEEEKQSIDDICQAENINRSTYFRDTKESTEMLSALIFGADGLSAMRQR